MTTFVFTETVPTALISTALGVAKLVGSQGVGEYVSADLNKAVKLSSANNYVLATAGDNIDAFIKAIEPFTVNDGVSFGGVQQEGRVQAVVGTGPLAVGDLVVADTQVALGTEGLAKVKLAVPVAGLGYWKVIRIVLGTGIAGDTVLLEKR